ncbi:CYFA0S05e01486g1_1 [Cyberlindnera fabianii]|uniref:CYFA0S05e01486g1_1 n=1 Tax=Cyberlindnera fabianii TaxID=36022 RepID=A0A061ASD7_CYBFA|nr:putative agmatinase 1 [Cyberlindnera fabianii]CDR40528.1 CYFA0S05e01486g1_1 [Cyberlindnera fabianii]
MLPISTLYTLAAFLASSVIAHPVAAPDAESQHVLMNCELADGVETSAHNHEDLSFMDQFFGPILDSYAADQVTTFGQESKKAPGKVTNRVDQMLVRDNYNYPDPDDLRDINGSAVLYRGGEFAGLNSFAHLPYANCYDPSKFGEVEFDVAVVGSPFDSGVSYRPGTRFGPRGIRTASQRLAGSTFSVYDGVDPYGGWAKLVDCGDPPITPLDNRIALDQMYRTQRAIGKHSTTSKNKHKTPKIFTLGGDHTITLPSIRAAYENWGQIAVVHIDSHLDTWNPYYFGGNVTEYQSVNHGTYLHWAHEKGLLAPDSCIHAAIRGPYPGKDDVKHDIECGFDRILARDIDKIGAEAIVEKIKKRVGDYPVYITVDVDSMDPAFAPASGTVEPGGWTSRELLTVLDGLAGLKVIGGDVVEVSPPYDTNAEVTSLAAAQVADSIIALMIFDSAKEDSVDDSK